MLDFEKSVNYPFNQRLEAGQLGTFNLKQLLFYEYPPKMPLSTLKLHFSKLRFFAKNYPKDNIRYLVISISLFVIGLKVFEQVGLSVFFLKYSEN